MVLSPFFSKNPNRESTATGRSIRRKGVGKDCYRQEAIEESRGSERILKIGLAGEN